MQHSELGLEHGLHVGERVAILVGPNGAGKSNFLLELAERNRDQHKIAVICNTAYDRFTGLRGVKRVSAGRGVHSPISVIKRCVLATLDKRDSRHFQIGSVLEYCGYMPRFGFLIQRADKGERQLSDRYFKNDDYRRIVDQIERHDFNHIAWADVSSTGSFNNFGIDLQGILRFERQLKKDKVLTGIDVHLERRENGRQIELHRASSGELSLMSSMIFLATTIRDDGVVIIDEPENSLHPGWQREYIDRILTTMRYHGVIIVVATHAPLIVTGAIAHNPGGVAVFQMHEGRPRRLQLDADLAGGSIEKMLWEAFEVLTPVSHFVSEKLVEAVSRFEVGKISKFEVFTLIDQMKEASFAPRQEAFLGAVSQLVDELDRKLSGGGAA